MSVGLVAGGSAACTEPQFLPADAADQAELHGDAELGVDAGATEAGSGGDPDALIVVQEATVEELDARAGTDAHDEPVRAEPACVDKPSVLGAECPGVVWCTDLGPCDQRDKICCLTAFSAECVARSDCGLAQRASCDGPEDCQAGEVCCARDGIARCSEPAACPESQRACHSEADCERNQCARGWPGTFGGLPVTYLADWGFCRTP